MTHIRTHRAFQNPCNLRPWFDDHPAGWPPISILRASLDGYFQDSFWLKTELRLIAGGVKPAIRAASRAVPVTTGRKHAERPCYWGVAGWSDGRQAPCPVEGTAGVDGEVGEGNGDGGGQESAARGGGAGVVRPECASVVSQAGHGGGVVRDADDSGAVRQGHDGKDHGGDGAVDG